MIKRWKIGKGTLTLRTGRDYREWKRRPAHTLSWDEERDGAIRYRPNPTDAQGGPEVDPPFIEGAPWT